MTKAEFTCLELKSSNFGPVESKSPKFGAEKRTLIWLNVNANLGPVYKKSKRAPNPLIWSKLPQNQLFGQIKGFLDSFWFHMNGALDLET